MRLLRKLAFPIALLYGFGIYIRNALYDWGWFRSTSFDTPMISVGNLSLGGTGKTPMIEWLISNLEGEYKLAVLSRGYGRATRGLIEAKPHSTAQDIGDEPRQILDKYPDLYLVVDEDRRRGVRWIETHYQPDIIILDDAHQHRRIKPAYAVILTDFNNLYTRDWFLPTGRLRDSRSQACRANCIVITKCPENLSPGLINALKREVRCRPDQPVFYTELEYDEMIYGEKNQPLTEWKDRSFTLVTGIAKPEPLVEFLKDEGYDFEHLKFRDHHEFTSEEIKRLNEIELLLLTEKDYARLGSAVPHAMRIRMRHRFLGQDARGFLACLNLRKPSASL